mmetsp:Transcript_1861/g.5626  ORF Transcript_1861/g.5626 Transcript_1861/m.5626 type:complete len:211 (+) Transcript_1861:111-743(+)
MRSETRSWYVNRLASTSSPRYALTTRTASSGAPSVSRRQSPAFWEASASARTDCCRSSMMPCNESTRHVWSENHASWLGGASAVPSSKPVLSASASWTHGSAACFVYNCSVFLGANARNVCNDASCAATTRRSRSAASPAAATGDRVAATAAAASSADTLPRSMATCSVNDASATYAKSDGARCCALKPARMSSTHASRATVRSWSLTIE